MNAFRFRAEAVLRLRERQRDDARGVHARALEALRETLADLERLAARAAAAEAAYRTALEAGAAAADLERHRNWIEGIRAERSRLQAVLDAKQTALSEALKRLQAAHRAVRMLERLRDRARDRHERAVREQERRAADEAASLRFARRVIDGGTGV